MQLPLSKDATKVRGAAMPRLGLVKLSAFVLLTSFVSVLVAEKSLCEEAEQMHSSGTGVEKSSQLLSKTKRQGTTKKIRQLSEIERPSTSAQMLLGQSPAPQTAPSAEVVQVTEVKANPTDKGVEIILQTTKGQALQLVNRSTGNTFIAEIPNAQLRLPSGERFIFRSEKPIGGVTEITVTNFDAKTIRVTVKGEAGVPIVELFDSPNEGLIFSVASTAQRAQQGQNPTPNSSPNLAEGQAEGSQQQQNQTQLTQPSASGDEPIELVVTGQQDGYLIPDASIAKTVTNFDAKTIRVTVKGEAGVPIVELFDSPNEGLIFSVASTAQRAQQGQNPTPNSSPNLAEGQAEGSQQHQNQTQLTQPSASGDEPIELVVTGQQDGYLIPDASIAKTDTPILNTSRSIQVIPQQVLEDHKVVELQHALRNVSGVVISGGPRDAFQNFTIRGFSSGGIYRNGLRIGSKVLSWI